MLFENFSGIIFFQNNFSADEDILQLQLHHNWSKASKSFLSISSVVAI